MVEFFLREAHVHWFEEMFPRVFQDMFGLVARVLRLREIVECCRLEGKIYRYRAI